MKRTIRLELTLLITLAMVTSATTGILAAARTNPSTITLTYTFPTPTITTVTIEGTTYQTATLPGTATNGRAGDPSLPTKGAYILLPEGTKLASVTVHGTSHTLGTGYHLQPISQAIPTDHDPIAPTINPVVYASSTPLPSSLYTIVGIQELRGYSILVLDLNPLTYTPATGELIAYNSLDVTVTTTPTQTHDDMLRGLPQDVALIQSRVDNPDLISTYQPTTLHRSSAEIMILTTSALKAGFASLAQAHNATGYRTIIRTLDDVGSTDQETIRQYIRTQYLTLGISWLLIGGDDTVVPCRELYVQGMDENVTPYEDNLPADIYYGCLDGPYNYNNNDKWGEPHDGTDGGDVDLMAEVWVGRACVDNMADTTNFVAKTRAYMNSTIQNDSYLSTVLLAGEYLGDYGIASYGSSYLNELINGSTDDGYTTVGIPAKVYSIDKLYDEDYGGYWQPSDLITRIDNNVHIINHLGHASPDYNMKLVDSDVYALSNTKLCFVYSQGCDSGWFDDYDCIAETFTVKAHHAAFAGVWNARYGFFWSYSTDGDSQRLNRQLWDAVFAENKTSAGAANHDSKEDNIFIINRSCIRWCVYETNLFGDPAVNLVQFVPPPPPPPTPTLSIDSVTGGNRIIQLKVTNIGDPTARDVQWNVKVTGGILHGIDLTADGTPFTILSGNTTSLSVTLPSLFGLGKVAVTTTMDYAPMWNGTGFVLGPFLLKVQSA